MVLDQSHKLPARAVASGDVHPVERVRFPAMGTQCEIQYCTGDAVAGKAFADEARNWVTAFEAKYTRFRPDSLIGRINAAAGREWVALDADAEQMFALADQVLILSQGVIDITMLPLLRLWDYKVEKPRVPSADEIREAASKVGWARVQREPGRLFLPETGMGLDLGGFGKEYAVDRVAQLAQQFGIGDFLVDFGHDVRVGGAPGGAPCWRIGVEDPMRPGVARSRLAINDGGVATSGDYIRHFEAGGKRFGHIIDPRSGFPVSNGCHAVTVIAGSCLEAGLLSTTAFVLGPEAGLSLIEDYFGAEGVIRCEDREFQTRGYYRYAI